MQRGGQSGDRIMACADRAASWRDRFRAAGRPTQIDQTARGSMAAPCISSAAAWARSLRVCEHVVVGRGVLHQRGRDLYLAGQQCLRICAERRIEGCNLALQCCSARRPGRSRPHPRRLRAAARPAGELRHGDRRAGGRSGFRACARSRSGPARCWWPAAAGSGRHRKRAPSGCGG